MYTVEEITAYIDENVVFSQLYDNASDKTKSKAINQAVNTLFKYMSDVYTTRDSIPIDDIVEQALWTLKIDDSFQRAEMGATMITVDGIQLQIGYMDRTISPKILSLYGIRDVNKRKSRAGSYQDSMEYRSGMGRDNRKWRGWRY
ncbi:hypothetical protein [Rummeliibacillus stabekisii]|uniref:hypothetical protein n=1 Tax=Rummeliibacillus stabekisii TaxID=241244 RepID=UPI00371DFD53